jgi:hypothetical protein
VGCEARKIAVVGGAFFLDFSFYRTFLGEFVGSLTQIQFLAGLDSQPRYEAVVGGNSEIRVLLELAHHDPNVRL